MLFACVWDFAFCPVFWDLEGRIWGHWGGLELPVAPRSWIAPASWIHCLAFTSIFFTTLSILILRHMYLLVFTSIRSKKKTLSWMPVSCQALLGLGSMEVKEYSGWQRPLHSCQKPQSISRVWGAMRLQLQGPLQVDVVREWVSVTGTLAKEANTTSQACLKMISKSPPSSS